jgi:hypothetical protein
VEGTQGRVGKGEGGRAGEEGRGGQGRDGRGEKGKGNGMAIPLFKTCRRPCHICAKSTWRRRGLLSTCIDDIREIKK